MGLTESNDKLLWALNEDSRQMLEVLVRAGWDRDLALAFMETLWGDGIYELL